MAAGAKAKALALIEWGECADLEEAAYYLLDMGEIGQDAADRLAAAGRKAKAKKAAN